MHTKKLVSLVFLVLLVGVAGPAGAATKTTLIGTLLDGKGAPLVGFDVTIRGDAFDTSLTTDKKGRFKVALPGASAEYDIRFEREGVLIHSETLTLSGSGVQRREWTMNVTPAGSATESMAALDAFNAGARAHNDGDYDVALEKFGEAVAEDPEFLEAHAVIARLYGARKDYDKAAAAAGRVVELDPNNLEALRILYDAQLELSDEGAGATLDRLVVLDPGRGTAVLVYNDGVAARIAGDPGRARARYELATTLDPTLLQAHTALGGVLMALKDYDAALASSERALALDPKDVRGNSIRYNTLIGMGRNDEAEAMLEELQTIAPDAVSSAFYERGTLLFDEGHIEPAVTALNRAVAADPQFAKAHYLLGLCHSSSNRPADAVRHLEMFLELAPNDPDANTARQLVDVLGRSE